MLYLKCTGDVQKAIGLRKENLADALPSEAPLGNWYVHRFNLDRGKAYILLTDLILHYQWAIERDGGLARCDLTRIIMKLNEMPQRRLKWATSWDLTQSALSLKI